MSESGDETVEPDGAAAQSGREIWIEKYRPQSLDEVVGQSDVVERLQSYVERDELPNLLFSGPAGVGKCVTGETPVLTNRGLERIEDVVGDTEGFADPDDDLAVLSLGDDGAFEYVQPSHVFGKRADDLRRVETRDGGTMTVTPEHQLLVVDESGLTWREVDDLERGDRIARPLNAPAPDTDLTVDWLDALDGERVFATVSEAFARRHDLSVAANNVGTKRAVAERLREGHSVDEIATELDTPRKTVQAYRRQFDDTDLDETATTCPLSTLRDLDVSATTLREAVETIEYVTTSNKRSPPITPPSAVTPDLAAFVGLAVSEARIEAGRVKFYNTDPDLLDRFERTGRELFGVEPTRGEQDSVPYVEFRSRTLTHYLASCFDVVAGVTDADGLGSTLVTAPVEARTAFLRAVFDAEAHVPAPDTTGVVELTQKNPRVITLLSYLLATLGIPSRRLVERKAATNGTGIEREYHTLRVSGSRHLARFRETVGFSIGKKADRLAHHAARESNPNHDTMPAQAAVDDLCERLHLTKGELVESNTDAATRNRSAHLADLDRVADAAVDRVETAQTVLEEVEALRRSVERIAAVPATWTAERSRLEPVETRRDLQAETGVRADSLLTYADGRRTPTARRTERLLSAVGAVDETPDVGAVQDRLRTAIESLGVPYERVADGTDLRGTEVINLLKSDDHDLASLPRFETVADRLTKVASGMLTEAVLERVQMLDRLAAGELYFDRVASVTPVDESRRVYDLTVPGRRNYVAGRVPTVMHNTTSSVAIARTVYGEDWRDNFLELNASDDRGIDVVRGRIKDFARASFGSYDYRIVFLDEADSLCLPPGTEVVTGYPSSPEVKPIEEVAEDGESMPSVDFETNELQSDTGDLVDSGVADFFEMELADGRSVTASPTHPFFVVGDDGRLVERELRELEPGDEIADFRDELGLSRCDVCGDWTAGRFCSLDCKNEGHSREMRGEGNPMYGTEWSDERREKIVEKLSDGRFAGADNPNYGGEFHGVHVTEMDEETVEQWKETLSEMRSGTPWEEWVVDADPEETKAKIGQSSAEWWASLDEDEREEIRRKAAENTDYPVCDMTGEDNPMRDPAVARKVSDALTGHEPFHDGTTEYREELGHHVRSSWEYEVATALQDAGVEYEYEPMFELSDSAYYPDFLVDDTVIEVKGVAELWGQTEKVEEFMQRYGDEYTFVVVGDGALPHDEHYDRAEFDPATVSDGGRREVSTVEVSSVEYSHRGTAYNVTMEGTPNFALGNGLLTHNTDDAQGALRRTMEQFSNNTRFILSCNYSSRIIDPIQSRCAVFRFSPLPDDAVADYVRTIAEAEGIEVTDDAVDALTYVADGDMRRALNALQAAAVTGDTVDEAAVYAITATARPEEIEEMVTQALDGEFVAARGTLDELLTDRGIAGGDVVDQLHRSVWDYDLSDEAAVRVLDRLGEADYRIAEGANERIQLESLLAAVARESERDEG